MASLDDPQRDVKPGSTAEPHGHHGRVRTQYGACSQDGAGAPRRRAPPRCGAQRAAHLSCSRRGSTGLQGGARRGVRCRRSQLEEHGSGLAAAAEGTSTTGQGLLPWRRCRRPRCRRLDPFISRTSRAGSHAAINVTPRATREERQMHGSDSSEWTSASAAMDAAPSPWGRSVGGTAPASPSTGGV